MLLLLLPPGLQLALASVLAVAWFATACANRRIPLAPPQSAATPHPPRPAQPHGPAATGAVDKPPRRVACMSSYYGTLPLPGAGSAWAAATRALATRHASARPRAARSRCAGVVAGGCTGGAAPRRGAALRPSGTPGDGRALVQATPSAGGRAVPELPAERDHAAARRRGRAHVVRPPRRALSQALARLRRAALEDGGAAAAAARRLYRRPSGAAPVASLSIKVSVPRRPGAYGEVAAAMPQALLRAAQQAVAAGAAPAARPLALSYAGFPGCYHAVAQLVLPGANGADVAAGLQALLPADVQLLGVQVSGEQQLPPSPGAGVWCDPVAVPLGAAGAHSSVSVVLPPALVEDLASAGDALRVVVSVPGREEPPIDQTLNPGEAGWPAEGVLDLRVPCCQGPLVHVALLRSPVPPPDGGADGGSTAHGVDVLLAALPLLVLADAAAAEVEALWTGILALWAREHPGGDIATAAAVQFGGEFVPFAHDFAALCVAQGLAGDAGLPVAGMLQFLEANQMHACARMLQDSAESQATPAIAAAAASSHAAWPPQAPAPGAPRGPSAPEKPLPTTATEHSTGPAVTKPPPDYSRWKAHRLQRMDACAVALDVLRMGAMAVALLQHATGRSAPPPPGVWLHFAVYAALVLLPSAVFVSARRTYLRWRGVLWSASVLVSSVVAVAILWGLADGSAWRRFGAQALRNPAMLALLRHGVQPALQQLSPAQQAVAAIGQGLTTYVAFQLSGRPVHALVAMGAALASVGLASAMDARLQLQWRRETGAA